MTIKLPGFSGLRWHEASEASVQGKPPNRRLQPTARALRSGARRGVSPNALVARNAIATTDPWPTDGCHWATLRV